MTDPSLIQIINRDNALEDLRKRVGEGDSVTNHSEGKGTFSCDAAALLAGLRLSDSILFVYYIEDGGAHICTGLMTYMDVEAKKRELMVSENGKLLQQRLGAEPALT